MRPMGPAKRIDRMSAETAVQWSRCRFVSGRKANVVGDIRALIAGGISGRERLDGAVAALRTAPIGMAARGDGAGATAGRGKDGGWRRS